MLKIDHNITAHLNKTGLKHMKGGAIAEMAAAQITGMLPALLKKTPVPTEASVLSKWLSATMTHYINDPTVVDFMLVEFDNAELLMPLLMNYKTGAELTITSLAMRDNMTLYEAVQYLPSVTVAHMLKEHADELASQILFLTDTLPEELNPAMLSRHVARHIKTILKGDIEVSLKCLEKVA